MMLSRGRYAKWGLTGGIVFLLGTTPLGVWTLANPVMAMAYLLTKEYDTRLPEMLRRHGWGTLVSAAGILWMGWFVVKVAVVGFVSWQQPVYFVVGVLILALAAPSPAGWLRPRSRPQSNRAFR